MYLRPKRQVSLVGADDDPRTLITGEQIPMWTYGAPSTKSGNLKNLPKSNLMRKHVDL